MSGFSVLSSAGALKVAGIVGPAGASGSGGGSGFPPGFSLDTEDVLEPLTIFPKINNVGDGSVFTFTTTGNIDNLDFAHARYIRANNATLATIRGLVAGYYDGQIVTIISIGAGEVDLNHQDTNSTAANRLLNVVTSAFTPLAAGAGVATYQYDLTTARWRLIEWNQGDFIQIAYASGNFTAASGTWTVDSGDQLTFGYWLRGRDCFYNIDIATSTNTGGQVTMRITLTGMPVISFSSFSVVWASDAGVDITTLVEAATGHNTQLYFYKFGGGNWGANTNTLRVTATGHYAIT